MKSSLVALSLFILLMSSALGQSPPKNVLFIGVDDLRVELGCYGAEHVQTPHIDSLAARGLLFERAYCQQAVCAPSRISLLTGMRPDSTGIFDLEHPLNRNLPDAMSMPRFFKEQGYRTISLGKIYHHPEDDKAYWDVMDRCSKPGYAAPEMAAQMEAKRKEARKRGLDPNARRHFMKGPAWENVDVGDDTYTDGAIAVRAIEQLRQSGDQPFFLAVGFIKPHLPFVAPRRYWNLYDPNEIAIPPRTPPRDAPKLATTSWGELRAYDGIPSEGNLSDEQTRTLIHGYRACVSYVDAQIGRLMAEVDRLGLTDNTLVVLWGDHGWKLGEYGDWCKHTNFELDTHVPLIFSGPGVPIGERSKALVEYIDLYPTLANWCGLTTPEACEGKSLLPLFANPSLPGRSVAMSQYPRGKTMGYSIRSERWRYTHWQRRDGKVIAKELYDHLESDVSFENVADRPDNTEIVERLENQLLNLIRPVRKVQSK